MTSDMYFFDYGERVPKDKRYRHAKHAGLSHHYNAHCVVQLVEGQLHYVKYRHGPLRPLTEQESRDFTLQILASTPIPVMKRL